MSISLAISSASFLFFRERSILPCSGQGAVMNSNYFVLYPGKKAYKDSIIWIDEVAEGSG
jgi:hypothetical protein